jgi:hypothetical protein
MNKGNPPILQTTTLAKDFDDMINNEGWLYENT